MVVKRSLQSVLIVFLAFVIVFTPTAKKVHAVVPVVLAGLTLGEALFYTAAIGVTGYALYESLGDQQQVVDNIKWAAENMKPAWNALSASAKASWAELEGRLVETAEPVVVTAAMWMDSMLAGIRGLMSTKTVVPAYDFPGANFKFTINRTAILEPEWVARYGIITMVVNGEEFVLVPTFINKDGDPGNGIVPHIVYDWVYNSAAGYTYTYTMPGAATSFNREKLVVTGHGTKYAGWEYVRNGYAYDRRSNPEKVIGLGFNYPTWNDALIGWQDATVALKLYLQTIYGGTVISAPTIPGLPDVALDKDITKPVAIPVPPGTITYPQTGKADLVLTPEIIKTIVTEMADAATVPPGTPGTDPPKGDWPDSLGQVFTTRFPFSLPWDLYGVLALLAADPVTPVFVVDSVFMGMDFNFSYSLDFLDPYMPWFRGFIIIGFCIFLIQITRNLLGGAK